MNEVRKSMVNESSWRSWTVVRFPNGSWSYGGRLHSPDYELCEKWSIAAPTAKDAVKKAQALRRQELRRQARAVGADLKRA